jgi:hypothetical protein
MHQMFRLMILVSNFENRFQYVIGILLPGHAEYGLVTNYGLKERALLCEIIKRKALAICCVTVFQNQVSESEKLAVAVVVGVVLHNELERFIPGNGGMRSICIYNLECSLCLE